MTFMTTELLIDNRPCMVYAMPEPQCLVLTTLGAHERKDFETLAQMITKQISVPFVQSHALLTPNVYLSLGIKEEKTRNRTLAQVGDNIRAYHDLLTHSLGEEHTALVRHNGGHFTDCTLRLAQAITWCISKQKTI